MQSFDHFFCVLFIYIIAYVTVTVSLFRGYIILESGENLRRQYRTTQAQNILRY